MKIIELECTDFTTDWYRDKKIQIDIDKYVFFEVEYRGGDCASWYLIGHRYDKDTDKWITEDFDYHMCNTHKMAKFIAKVNNIKDKNGFTRNRVSRFNNLHYAEDFYEKLNNLFNNIKKYEKEEN